MAADLGAFNNYRTNIYFDAYDVPPFWTAPDFVPTRGIFFSNTTSGNSTEAERIYLSEGEAFLRYSVLGIYADLSNVKTEVSYQSKPYFRYIDNLVFSHNTIPCLPPYNDFVERFKDKSRGATPCLNVEFLT